jgi:integrase
MKGSIRSRGKNTWQLRFEGRPDGAGRRKYLAVTFHGNKTEAQRELRKKITAVEEGTHVDRNHETIAGFMEYWLVNHAEVNTTPRTVQGYRQKITAYIIPCLGGVKIQNLTAKHIQELHHSMLSNGLSNQSVVHAHRVLSKALECAIEWEIIPRNPAPKIKPPRPEPKGIDVWNMVELGRFAQFATDSQFSDVFRLAIFTGLRRSELAGLRWDQIDSDTKTLRVTETLQRIVGRGLLVGKPKTKTSRRAIALGETANNLLQEIRWKQIALRAQMGGLYQNQAGYVFTDALGAPIDPDRLTKEFAKVIKRAELPGSTFHSLRHIHASLLLAEGVNPKAISERLGHSKVSLTLDIYAHLLPGLQESAAVALDRRLSHVHGLSTDSVEVTAGN